MNEPTPSLRIEIDPAPEHDEQGAVIAAITALLAEQRTATVPAPPVPLVSRWAAAGRTAAHHRKQLRDDWRGSGRS
jgi:hypothetical protein